MPVGPGLGPQSKNEDAAKKPPSPTPEPPVVTGPRAPSFQAQTMSGERIDFPSDFKGRLVLLDFWATWCGPCRNEMPLVARAHEQFAARGLTVLGITLDGVQRVPATRVEHFTRDRRMPWAQIYENAARLANLFGVTSIPAAFLIDGSTGVILASGEALRGEALYETVKRHLK